jgi:3-deoxy-D-manno-octulosonate 8-phosphate phosphatase (KDO 8-P phosphatase)
MLSPPGPIDSPSWLPPDLLSPFQRFALRLGVIKLLMLDVDGVLTDGSLLYSSHGDEVKAFNVKDGQGLSLLPGVGIQTGLLTARQSPLVQRRANDVGMTYVCQAAKPKWPVLQQILYDTGISAEQVAYMGDDWPDVAVLGRIGFACCPIDAMPVVQASCHWISPYAGGCGAVRSLCDLLLAVNGFQARE